MNPINRIHYPINISGSRISNTTNNSIKYTRLISGESFPNSNCWDICYKHPYPYNILCNFFPSFFRLNGVEINSMEGFLQSLKTPDAQLQKKICQLPGILAKKLGNYFRKSQMYDGIHLHWQGKIFDRYSEFYQHLLHDAYNSKYNYDEPFRRTILKSKGHPLTHTIGKSSESETVLTEKEFIDNLNALRNSRFHIGRFFTRRGRNALTIAQNLPELRTSFVNSTILCGENVFTKDSNIIKKLKEHGVANIIEMESSSRALNNRKIANNNQIEYLNINLPIADIDYRRFFNRKTVDIPDDNIYLTHRKFVNKDLVDLINMRNSNTITYICCKNREDSSLILMLNYLFNPKADIADAPVFGGLKKKNIQKFIYMVKKCITPETKKQLGWDKDFESVIEARKKILHELNA